MLFRPPVLSLPTRGWRGSSNKTVEFDKNGKAVWIVTNKDLGTKHFADPCGGQRLPNGNTIVSSYGQRNAKKARIFEITPDKKVVWEFYHPITHGHGVHVITTNGKQLSNNKMK